MPRILYFCPDYPQPSGGVKRLYRHVFHLHRLGFDAAIVHQKKGFVLTWHGYQAPVMWLADQLRFEPDDILVFPETALSLIEQTQTFTGQRVVIALNWAPAYLKLSPDETWQDYGITQVITPSRVIQRYLAWRMDVKAILIDTSIDATLYRYEPVRKRKKIAYMSRKDPAGSILQATFERKGGLFNAYEWQPMRDLVEDAYARVLREARIYLSPSPQEGINTSVLEAMAAGCLIVGYSGVGGSDYMIGSGEAQNCILVENGNLPEFGVTLEQVLRTWEQGSENYTHIIQNALATARRYQDFDQEARSLQAFFEPLCASASPARQQESQTALTLVHRAVALKQAGQHTAALTCYREALALDDGLPEVWFNFANSLHQQDHVAEAENAYRQAIARSPGLYQAYFNLGNLLRDQGRAEEAEDCYRQTIRFKPDFARAYTNLGNLLRAQERIQEAIAHHQRAIQLSPNDADAYYNLGNVLMAARAYRAAIKAFQQALAIRPHFPQARENLDIVMQKRSDTDF